MNKLIPKMVINPKIKTKLISSFIITVRKYTVQNTLL